MGLLRGRSAAGAGSARGLAGAFVFACALLLGGCSMMLPQTTALQDRPPPQLPERVRLDQVPFVAQEENLCGPAALKMALAGAQIDVGLDQLKREVFLPGRQGSLQAEMLAAPRRHGTIPYKLAPKLEDVLREVAAGTPVIVLQDYGVWPVSAWHYAVVVGYDYPRRRAILNTGLKAGMEMPFAVLEYLWKQSGYWAMVVQPPDRLPATAEEGPYVDAIAAVEKTGDLRAARLAYAAALGRWPDDLKAAVGLANAYYESGDLKQSEAALRTAVERHPDSPILLNNLAQTLSDLGRNAEALEVIDRAAVHGGDFTEAIGQTRRQIVERMRSAAR
jgi:tetratricopeptide (TPR) repeat protein